MQIWFGFGDGSKHSKKAGFIWSFSSSIYVHILLLAITISTTEIAVKEDVVKSETVFQIMSNPKHNLDESSAPVTNNNSEKITEKMQSRYFCTYSMCHLHPSDQYWKHHKTFCPTMFPIFDHWNSLFYFICALLFYCWPPPVLSSVSPWVSSKLHPTSTTVLAWIAILCSHLKWQRASVKSGTFHTDCHSTWGRGSAGK